MDINDLVGKYAIKGTNQDREKTSYRGILALELNADNKIDAHWTIGSGQTQQGTGFFKDDILVVNFNYQGDDEKIFKGVVVYRCLNRNILKGFWSEKYGDQKMLGEENGFRIDPFDDINLS